MNDNKFNKAVKELEGKGKGFWGIQEKEDKSAITSKYYLCSFYTRTKEEAIIKLKRALG